jgi:uncharacterized membrane protein YhaH (DUF805 family)
MINRRAYFYWVVATIVVFVAVVLYLRANGPDELVTANSLDFQIMVSLIVVAPISLLSLLLMMALQALIQRRRSNNAMDSDTAGSPLRAPSGARHRER